MKSIVHAHLTIHSTTEDESLQPNFRTLGTSAQLAFFCEDLTGGKCSFYFSHVAKAPLFLQSRPDRVVLHARVFLPT